MNDEVPKPPSSLSPKARRTWIIICALVGIGGLYQLAPGAVTWLIVIACAVGIVWLVRSSGEHQSPRKSKQQALPTQRPAQYMPPTPPAQQYMQPTPPAQPYMPPTPPAQPYMPPTPPAQPYMPPTPPAQPYMPPTAPPLPPQQEQQQPHRHTEAG